ncbi:MAG: type II toxin-antitoxin system RelE/ParE family toxin [Oscillospiraceae bacterium]|nr:type II toxin-antitoxin system RelE/ParE family toxin [Oscillospiraceae bacterium]
MKEYKVLTNDTAKQEILNIRRYISKELKEPLTAKNVYNSINSAIKTLTQLPLRFPIVDTEPHKSREIRKMPVKNYYVFYVVDEEESNVHVLSVMYNRRNWHMLV